ncbi:3-hydroxyphenylacetate 6-hydroxylase [Apiospora arundinis]
MDAPRDTANVGLKEIFGVPYLISDPKYQEAFQDRMKRGASILGGAPEPHSPSLYSTAGDGVPNPSPPPSLPPLDDSGYGSGSPSSKQSGSSQQQQQQPPQPQIPTDLQEGEYDFGYAAPATRQWQRFDTPLVGPGDRSLDQSPAARQQRLAQNHLPRFLFRGYSQRSGGGNPHLNQWDKIIPHAFMNTDYMSCVPHFDVRNYPRRDEVIEAHLTGTTTDEVLRQTPFSSWSQSPQVALRYSGGARRQLRAPCHP